MANSGHEDLVPACGTTGQGDLVPESLNTGQEDLEPEFENIEQPRYIEQLAAVAGVGKNRLWQYLTIKGEGNSELIEAVKNGKLKIGTAYKMTESAIDKELKRANKMYAYATEQFY